EAAEALLAPLISPAFTGVPTAPTASPGTNTTQIASTAFVAAADVVLSGSVSTETSRAEAAEALLAPLISPAFTGVPTAPTASPGTNTTQIASTAFVAAAKLGTLNDRGNYDASSNVFPSSGGSGTAGAILKGDLWYISVAGTLGGTAVIIGDTLRSLVDTPGQTSGNWDILQVAGIYVTPSSTQVLTNKTITNRENTITSSTTPTPVADTTDIFTITALSTAATFGVPTYTTAPTQGQGLIIRIKDNGSTQTLAWNTIYRVVGATLPLTTVINKLLYVALLYNYTNTKWDVVAVSQE
ncbi:MAG: hypothetical protein ACHP6H_03075, partial [Legionellales bacterium]